MNEGRVAKLKEKGWKCLQSEDFDKAANFYKRATKLNPDDAEAWYFRAFCYMFDYDDEKALECVNKALSLEKQKYLEFIKFKEYIEREMQKEK